MARRFKVSDLSLRSLAVPVVVVVVLGMALWQAGIWYRARLLTDARGQVSGRLMPYENALSIAVNQRLALIEGLSAFAGSHPNVSELKQTFSSFAAGLYASKPGIRSVQIFPPEGLSLVYPMEGNEAAAKRSLQDLLHDERPEVQADVVRALQTRQVTLSGPYELRQGGLGLVCRQAIYHQGQLWGFAVIIVDMPAIFQEVRLAQLEPDLLLGVRDEEGSVFYGDAQAFQNDPITYRMNLVEGQWELAAVPRAGWAAFILPAQNRFMAMGGILVGLLLFLLVGWVSLYQDRLRYAVRRQTDGLTAEIQERKRAQAQSLKLTRVYTMLSEINQAVVRIRDPQELLEKACQIAAEKGGYELAWVGYLSPDAQRLNRAASSGRANSSVESVGDSLSQVPDCPIHAVLRGDGYAVCDPLARQLNSPACQLHAAQLGFAAMASFPLRVAETTCGVLNLYAGASDRFDEPELKLLNELTMDISYALEYQRQEKLRQQAEEALDQKNHLLTALINSPMGVVIFSLDRDYCYTSFNENHREEMQKIWHVDIEVGMYLLDLMPVAELREAAKNSIDQALGGKAFTEIQIQPDVDIAYEISWNPIFREGDVIGVTAFVRNITDRLREEAALRESENKYRVLVENVNEAIYVAQNGRLMFVNRGFMDFCGLPAAALIGQPIEQFVAPEYHDLLMAHHDRIQQPGALKDEIELRAILPDGRERYLWVGAVQIEWNRQPASLNFATDITARKYAEKALLESEERYRTVVANAPVVTFVLDEHGIFMLSEGMGLARLGLRPGQVVGQSVFDVYADYPDICASVRRAFGGEAVRSEINVQGSIYDAFYSPVFNNQQQVEKVIGVASDITDRKHAEEELYQLNLALENRVAERTAQLEASNQELESFAYSVSHDLRTPLRAINGFSGVLAEEYSDLLDAEGTRILNVIRHNTNKMERLISELLSLAQISRRPLRRVRMDMTALVHAVYEETVLPDVRASFAFSVGNLPPAHGDVNLIQQVWGHLISNAVKYTLPQAEHVIQVSGWVDGDFCVYAIQDSGVGFNPAYAHKLFGPFQRLHKVDEFEGTGIGLPIVQRIVQRHGGQVWAESNVGEGARFYFSLPRLSEEALHA